MSLVKATFSILFWFSGPGQGSWFGPQSSPHPIHLTLGWGHSPPNTFCHCIFHLHTHLVSWDGPGRGPSWQHNDPHRSPSPSLKVSAQELGTMGIPPARKEKVISLYSGRRIGCGDSECCGLEDRPRCGEMSALQISVTVVTGYGWEAE